MISITHQYLGAWDFITLIIEGAKQAIYLKHWIQICSVKYFILTFQWKGWKEPINSRAFNFQNYTIKVWCLKISLLTHICACVDFNEIKSSALFAITIFSGDL